METLFQFPNIIQLILSMGWTLTILAWALDRYLVLDKVQRQVTELRALHEDYGRTLGYKFSGDETLYESIGNEIWTYDSDTGKWEERDNGQAKAEG